MDPSAKELVADLRSRGVKLWVDGGLLRFSASKSALSPPLMAKMRKHKAAILEILESEEPDIAGDDLTGPVSMGQESLWLLHQQHPDSAAYNTAATMRFVSEVNVDALRSAFQKLIARHTPLRTTFRRSDDGVEAVVHASDRMDFAVECAADVQDEALLLERVREAYAIPFDLETGPLIRVRLFSRSAADHVLLIVVHHIVFDAWSLWLMQDELRKLYESEVSGEDCLLPKMPADYVDFVRWQREFPETEAGAQQWNYWKSQLAGDPVPAELLWDFPRQRRATPKGATLHFSIDQKLAESLRQLGKSENATPFATGLCIFQTLLYRHTQQADSVVGVTTSGRGATGSQKEFSEAIGYFVNTLPIRSQLNDQLTFSEALASTKQTALEALQNQDLPFAELVHRLQPMRDPGAPPLCRAVFGLQKPTAGGQDVAALLAGEGDEIDWGGARVAPFKMDQQEGQFDLVLELYETSAGFAGVLKYDLQLLSRQTAQRLADRFVYLWQQIVEDPSRPLGEYELLPAGERRQILEWSVADAITGSYADHVDQMFHSRALTASNDEALVFADVRMTYQDLNDQVSRVAAWLIRRGVQHGQAVVVALPRSVETPVLMLACFRCGAIYVPISPLSPGSRANAIIDDCSPAMLVASAELAEQLTASDVRAPVVTQQQVFEESDAVRSPAPDRTVRGEDTAYIIYTSGSTGIPKGISVSHVALCQHVASMTEVFGTNDQDRVYQFSDFTFDPSVEQMIVPWSVGACCVFREDALPSADSFWQLMIGEKITVANLPPKYFEECSREMPVGEDWQSKLRLMIVGGDVFPSNNVQSWHERGVRLVNAYGPTEAIITATTFDVEDAGLVRTPIGRPKPGASAYVLTPSEDDIGSANTLAPIGVAGELCLGGDVLADGYVNASDLTDKQFVSVNINGRDQRVYRTGDSVRWNSDGQLEFLGRIDRQVKVRGFRIELGEIEAVLADHDEIETVVVKSFEFEDQTYLGAFVGLCPASEFTPQKLSAYLKQRLPIYMIPQKIEIVDKFPLLPSGKIDHNALIAAPPSTGAVQRSYVAPRNPVEEVMASVWSRILGLERVGVLDDFYELGGGSLQSLRIVSELGASGLVLVDQDDGKLEPQMLFQYTTISDLSPHLQQRASSPSIANP